MMQAYKRMVIIIHIIYGLVPDPLYYGCEKCEKYDIADGRELKGLGPHYIIIITLSSPA